MEPTPKAFKFRGVVEGFYGQPWSHHERLISLDYFKSFGMNLYIIGPKDASWQRLSWREPFDEDFLEEANELVAKGNQLGIQVTYSLSPGLSVIYSSVEDRTIVLEKFKQIASLGVTHFCLMWDDIDWELQDARDKIQYQYIEDGQSDFTNWVYQELITCREDISFTLCPMIYWGRNSNPYIKQLASNLNANVNIMWTGRQIRSEYLDTSDAIIFESDAGRSPFYWDNFPVNNLNLRNQLHAGPYMSREDTLSQHSVGIVVNPMNQMWASLLSLSTVGRYLCDPIKYSPWEAWESSLVELFPNELDREAAKTFFASFTNSQISNDSAPELRKILHQVRIYLNNSENIDAANLLTQYAQKVRKSYLRILSPEFQWPELKIQISSWLAKWLRAAELIEEIARQITLENQISTAAKAAYLELTSDRVEIFGEVLEDFLIELQGS